MTEKITKCGICDAWFVPSAHHYHCPSCGSAKLAGKYYDVVSCREVVKGLPSWANRVKEIAVAMERIGVASQ